MSQQIAILVLCLLASNPGWSQTKQPIHSPVGTGSGGILLPAAVNTIYQEGNPVLSADGQALYFSRKGHPLNYGLKDETDIWVSNRLGNGAWSRAINIGAPLNSQAGNRIAGVCAGGNRLYLIHSDDELAAGHSGLYYSEREGRSWSAVQPVVIDSLEQLGTDVHFFPSLDEQVLLLSTDQPGGYGRRDLYAAHRKKEGGWGVPRNLGSLVNTPGDERRMVLAADGRTLYFSSDGHPSLGGTDLFVSRRLDENWTNWSPPVSLGEAINSSGDEDEFSTSAAGETLLLARQVASGNIDILQFTLPEHLRPAGVTVVQGQVAAASIPVVYTAFSTGTGVGLPSRITPHRDGEFRLVLPAGKGTVSLFIEDAEHFGPSYSLALDGTLLAQLDTEVDPVMPFLRHHPGYQQGEKAIEDVAHQILETRKQRLASLKNVQQYQYLQPVLPFDTTLLREESLLLVADRYRALLLGEANPGDYQGRKGAAPAQSDRPDSIAERLKRLRQQYREQYEGEASVPSVLYPSFKKNDFEQYCRKVWKETTGKMIPEVKNSLDSSLIAERLQSRQSSAQSDLAQIRFLKEQLERLTTGRAEEGKILLPEDDWIAQMNRDIEMGLRQGISTRLRQMLLPPAQQALNAAFRLHQKSIHLANLERSLYELLQQQIVQEQNTGTGDVTPERPAGTRINQEAGYREVILQLEWLPLEEGQIWPLRSVLFEQNSSRLLPFSYAELKRVATLLKNHPSYGVEVAAHAHGDLSHREAQQISGGRAAAVGRALIEQGLTPDRIQTRGYGRCFPVASNDTTTGKRQNQRMELRLFKLKGPSER